MLHCQRTQMYCAHALECSATACSCSQVLSMLMLSSPWHTHSHDRLALLSARPLVRLMPTSLPPLLWTPSGRSGSCRLLFALLFRFTCKSSLLTSSNSGWSRSWCHRRWRRLCRGSPLLAVLADTFCTHIVVTLLARVCKHACLQLAIAPLAFEPIPTTCFVRRHRQTPQRATHGAALHATHGAAPAALSARAPHTPHASVLLTRRSCSSRSRAATRSRCSRSCAARRSACFTNSHAERRSCC